MKIIAKITSILLTFLLSVASATAGIRHYCNYTTHTVFVTSSTSSSTSTAALITENKRDYYGEDLVYRNDTLEMVLTDVGYVDAQGRYHYYILDYQGNVRQVVDAQGNVLEQNDYYPYGGLFGESASRQNYKYSGKELERMNGLNTYDFHARPYYYPVLQFHSPDLLSEKYYHVSPYLYCLGNPIKYTDPTGMFNIDEIADNTNYGVVMVVRADYIDDDNKMKSTGLESSVNAAKNNIPTIIVDDLPDFSLALSTINAIETSVTTYVLLSHGTEGQFNIGNTAITSKTDVSSLKSGLSEKNVFLYSCQSAAGEVGSKLLENFSKQTSSTVIGSGHNMRGGYKFDGSSDLTKIVTSIIDGLLNVEIQNDFKISINGDRPTEIYNFRLTKDGSLMWDLEN